MLLCLFQNPPRAVLLRSSEHSAIPRARKRSVPRRWRAGRKLKLIPFAKRNSFASANESGAGASPRRCATAAAYSARQRSASSVCRRTRRATALLRRGSSSMRPASSSGRFCGAPPKHALQWLQSADARRLTRFVSILSRRRLKSAAVRANTNSKPSRITNAASMSAKSSITRRAARAKRRISRSSNGCARLCSRAKRSKLRVLTLATMYVSGSRKSSDSNCFTYSNRELTIRIYMCK